MTKYLYATVDGRKIFYREAGSNTSPNILLLHGFPTSSHMFRNLIPALADRFRLTPTAQWNRRGDKLCQLGGLIC